MSVCLSIYVLSLEWFSEKGDLKNEGNIVSG